MIGAADIRALPKPAKREKPKPSRIRRSAPIARTAVRKALLSTRRGQARKADKRARISKRPKASRKKAVLYADSLWSQIIRRRSATCVSPRLAEWREGVYVPCGKPTSQAAHGYDRADVGARWDLRNGWPSCYSCNCLVYQNRKRVWFAWVEQQWGPALTAEMRAKAGAPAKTVDLASVTSALEAVLHMGVDVPTTGGEA